MFETGLDEARPARNKWVLALWSRPLARTVAHCPPCRPSRLRASQLCPTMQAARPSPTQRLLPHTHTGLAAAAAAHTPGPPNAATRTVGLQRCRAVDPAASQEILVGAAVVAAVGSALFLANRVRRQGLPLPVAWACSPLIACTSSTACCLRARRQPPWSPPPALAPPSIDARSLARRLLALPSPPPPPCLQGDPKTCPSCAGTGGVVCFACQGSGKMKSAGPAGTAAEKRVRDQLGRGSRGNECRACKGSGKIFCKNCKGSGFVY